MNAPRDSTSPSFWAKARTSHFKLLHLATLCSLAIAEPIYHRLSDQADYLADPEVTTSSLLILVLLLSFILPGIMFLPLWLLNRGHGRRSEELHQVEITILLACLLLPMLQRMPWMPEWLMVIGSLLLAGLGTLAYVNWEVCRRFVTVCSPCIVAIPLMFLIGLPMFAEPEVKADRSLKPTAAVPVVMVVFDEFCGSSLLTPEREIDARRFPNFAALAQESTWFRNASAVSPYTMSALPAILTGRYPTADSKDIRASSQNLFLTLANHGYEMAAFEPVSRLYPHSLAVSGQRANLCQQTLRLMSTVGTVYLYHLLPKQFEILLPPIPRAWFSWNDSRQVDPQARRGVFHYAWSDDRHRQFQHFLNCMDSTSGSVLYFGHFVMPHYPWCYLPSGTAYASDQFNQALDCVDPDADVIPDEFATTQDHQRHLLQVMFVDRLLGQLLDRLTEVGIRDRCLLIVTADHGISFRTGRGRRGLTIDTADDILSIPLFIKLPAQSAGVQVDSVAESVDVLPTIADVLGMDLTSTPDGQSLFGTSQKKQTLRVTPGTGIPMEFDPAILTDSSTPRVIRSRFGDSADPLSIYRIGPYPELIGRAVADLPQSTLPPVMIQSIPVNNSRANLNEPLIPCWWKGNVTGSSETPLILAVAVDGIIQATTRAYPITESVARWSVMVPEAAFPSHQEEISIYLVSAPPFHLTPCQRSD